VRAGDGPVLVTGASGGVGSIAVMLLARLGHEVTAATGRIGASEAYLRGLGARELIDRAELARAPKPLESERWAGAIDSVGGETLATVLAQTRYGGTVAACGLAGGMTSCAASRSPGSIRSWRVTTVGCARGTVWPRSSIPQSFATCTGWSPSAACPSSQRSSSRATCAGASSST
jgi:NADPH:quinone reductase-like Zn-dependent oxidoreductase